jgi:hypothetical protein
MPNTSDDIALAATDQETLGAILRRFAYSQVPSRFYASLQLCAPMAIQAWVSGWHRTAGWCVAASLFGLWGIAQQRVAGYSDESPQSGHADMASPRRSWRFVRRFAAATGIGLGVLLASEAFIQFLAHVFNCPGCAG